MKPETEALILVSNDDGVHAVGIQRLAAALAPLGRVVVIAPDREQSAASHKLSLHQPIRVTEVRPGALAVDGTPTDCVYLGIHELLGARPDLVVSGINHGPNLGTDVHYSGTVAAAVEGTLMGVPSFAVSCVARREPNWDHAARFAAELAAWVLAEPGRLPKGVTLNVNVPGGAPPRYRWARLGHRLYDHSVERREDPRGRTYYWIGGNPSPHADEPGTDSQAVRDGFISVTPLGLDLTDFVAMPAAPGHLGSTELEATPPAPADFRLGSRF